jgi:transketolase
MASTAAGLALTGKIPFINSFAVFSTGRCYDQLRQTISIARLNVKICGSSAGLSDYGDGSTHQSVEDVSLMRGIPGMTVLVPVDAVQTTQMVAAMVKQIGPAYIRINRNDLPILTPTDQPFEIGKIYTVREGKDVVIFANGVMVSKSLVAAERLEKDSLSVKVVNVPTVKPLDRAAIIAATTGTMAVVTAEEHSVIGGLGSAIAEALRLETGVPIDFVGIEDEFGTSALNYDEIMAHYGLTAEVIYDRIKGLLSC